MRKNTLNSGFTLIELIIVVVLLGILLLLVLTRLPTSITDTAASSVDSENYYRVQSAVDIYMRLDYYPPIPIVPPTPPWNANGNINDVLCLNTEYFVNGCPSHSLGDNWCLDFETFQITGLLPPVFVHADADCGYVP